MKKLTSAIGPSVGYILKDKINLLFVTIPFLIGSSIYYFIGRWMYGPVLESGREFVKSKISQGMFGDILFYLIMSVMTVVLFFIINWTFVLLLSVISSPFNDLISSRIEKMEKGQTPETIGEGFGKIFSQFFSTIWNELKKISVIMFFTIFAFLLSFFPPLMPLSFIISAILLTVQFADYSWSRHSMNLTSCIGDVKSNFFSFLIIGSVFMLMVSVPIINLIVSPLATSFITVYWVRARKS